MATALNSFAIEPMLNIEFRLSSFDFEASE